MSYFDKLQVTVSPTFGLAGETTHTEEPHSPRVCSVGGTLAQLAGTTEPMLPPTEERSMYESSDE
jgi:hypothetical protein